LVFNETKYTKWYNDIIGVDVRRGRPIGYAEKHHIIPRALGGSNHPSNLVYLTAREHFIAHLLLPKMVNDHKLVYKMYHALFCMMSVKRTDQERYTKFSSKQYEVARISFVKRISEIKRGQSISDAMKTVLREYIRTPQTRQQMSDSAKRRMIDTDQTGANNPRFRGYYITPWGEFSSYHDASKGYPWNPRTIYRWCRYPHTKIRNREEIPDDWKNKTASEVGFSFRGIVA
jgi:hypothetical protein